MKAVGIKPAAFACMSEPRVRKEKMVILLLRLNEIRIIMKAARWEY